ncbi:MAG TPA: GAF domain-containing protein [Acidobacteriota bacterium]|nr:GAF domain-containing protein [Acidobacteriota bacterium]
MTPEIADWLVSLFFLLALLLVLRFKKQVGVESRRSYNQIAVGLAILALVAVSRVHSNAGLFNSVPFLSEPVFYELVIWIAAIFGAAMLVGGVSHWLPAIRAYRRYNETKVHHLEFLKRLEQLVSVEGRLDTVLATTVDYMMEHFGFKDGAAVKLSRGGTLHLTAKSRNLGLDRGRMYRLSFSKTGWQKYLDGTPAQSAGIITGLADLGGHPQVVLPVSVANRPVAFFLLWRSRDTNCDHDDELNLRIAGDIIARKIQLDQVKLHRQWLRGRDRQRLNLERAFDSAPDLKSQMTALANGVTDLSTADVLSLLLVDERQPKATRVTVGDSGTVLVEHLDERPGPNTLAGRLLDSDRVRIIEDIGQAGDVTVDEFLRVHNLKSLVALPHRVSGTRALFVAGSRRLRQFDDSTAAAVETIRPFLARILLGYQAQAVAAAYQRRAARLNGLTTHVTASAGVKPACDYAARLLADELDLDFVRISLLDGEAAFLESRALVVRGFTTGMVPENGTMVLSLMPQHERVIQRGEVVLIQSGREPAALSEIEASQVFAPVLGPVCLMPITGAGRVVGVLSLAAAGAAARSGFEAEEMQFVASVAELLALAARLSVRTPDLRPGVMPAGPEPVGEQMETALKSRVRSPLTGILGSVEMLRSRPQADQEQVNRYLSIIDRSARRISAYLHEEAGS